MGLTDGYLPVGLPPYEEHGVELTPQQDLENTYSGTNIRINVTYMIVKLGSNKVTSNTASFRFKSDMPIGLAADLAVRNYPGDLEALVPEQRVVFYRDAIHKPITMVGSLNEKLEDFYRDGSEMWVSNDIDCFKKASRRIQQIVWSSIAGALLTVVAIIYILK